MTKEYTIATLWDSREVDKPYILTGDKVQVQSREYLLSQGYPETNIAYRYCDQILKVVKQEEETTDLWYTQVVDEDGNSFELYDDEIAVVFRK